MRLQKKFIDVAPYSAGGSKTTNNMAGVANIAALVLELSGKLTIASAGAAGTLVTEPYNPSGLVKSIVLTESPGAPNGESTTIDPQLLLLIPMIIRRNGLPPLATIANGSNQSNTVIQCSFFLPLSAWGSPIMPFSLRDWRNATNVTVTINWQATDAAEMLQLVTGNTSGVATWIGLQVNIYALWAPDAPAPYYRVGNSLVNKANQKGAQPFAAALGAGAIPLYSLIHVQDNSAPSNAFAYRFTADIDGLILADPYAADLIAENQAECNVTVALWPTGFYALDYDRLRDGSGLVMAPGGGVLTVVEDSGATAATATSQTSMYHVYAVETALGRQVRLSAGAATR